MLRKIRTETGASAARRLVAHIVDRSAENTPLSARLYEDGAIGRHRAVDLLQTDGDASGGDLNWHERWHGAQYGRALCHLPIN
tara:strand:- start:1462 stop:1710 length:249 start_codon:yes stop_codon:yes gene_type:complete